MITIELNQEVVENRDYVTSEEGQFSVLDFVLCKRKLDNDNGLVRFLVQSIVGEEVTYEASF